MLNFYVNIQDKQDVRTTPGRDLAVGYPGGYYGYRSGYYRVNTTTIETVNYKQGTLTIDLIDAKLESAGMDSHRRRSCLQRVPLKIPAQRSTRWSPT